MKNLLTTFCFLTLYLIAPAQDKEFTGGINTGFFSFRGKSAVNTSFINVSDVTSIPNYTNDIYSKKAGAGIGINFSLQKVTKAKIIYGLSAAIEILKSTEVSSNKIQQAGFQFKFKEIQEAIGDLIL